MSGRMESASALTDSSRHCIEALRSPSLFLHFTNGSTDAIMQNDICHWNGFYILQNKEQYIFPSLSKPTS